MTQRTVAEELNHTLMGSTAEYVVRYAPCPVLVVPGWGPGRARPTRRGMKRFDLLCLTSRGTPRSSS